MSNTNILFTPFHLGKLQIKNRFVMGPMGCNQSFDSFGALNHDGIEYFTERAKGGYGLIYTGVMMVDSVVDGLGPTIVENPLYAPGRFMNRGNEVNERVGAYGAKMIAEIGFGGGRTYAGFKGPSEVEVFGMPGTVCQALTKDEIHKKQEEMIQAASICKAAGFSGVDIHALHWGYLLDQFLMPITNKREDEYGGNLENRMRVITEIVQGIHQVCGDDYPVTVGLGVKAFIKGLNQPTLHGEEEAGRTVEEAVAIAVMLEKIGVAGILTDVGIYDSFYHAMPPSYMPPGHVVDFSHEITKKVSIPVMVRSRMGDPQICREAVESGKVTAVVHARPALADPYFPMKVEMGCEEKIRPCIVCNVGCYGHQVEEGKNFGCAVNPRAAKESITRPRKAVNARKIAVIGGGAAGMQAAITAAECGHQAELFEKRDVLGGELIAAGADSTKVEVRRFKDWLIRELEEKKVSVHMNREVTAEEIQKEGFDTVILAVGAQSIMPQSIKGIEKAISAVELLEGSAPAGKRIVVVGGGQIGCETAVDMAKAGHEVTILEAMPEIMGVKYAPGPHKQMLKALIEELGVQVVTGRRIVAVTEEGAVTEPASGDGKVELIPADTVVMSIGMRPNRSMRADFAGMGIAVYEVGSGRQPGSIYEAIHDAFEVVYYLD